MFRGIQVIIIIMGNTWGFPAVVIFRGTSQNDVRRLFARHQRGPQRHEQRLTGGQRCLGNVMATF